MIGPGSSIIQLCAVSRQAESAAGETPETVHDITLSFAPKTFSIILGERSDGSRLLVRLIGLLEKADSGEIIIEGNSVRSLSEAGQAEFRARRFGLLFPAPFLLPAFTAIENVAMPIFKLHDATPEEAAERAERLLAMVGMAEHAQTDAGELSLYEQHCIALARALAHQPGVLLAEGLDTALSGEPLHRFHALLRQSCNRLGVTVIAALSPNASRPLADRMIHLASGRIRSDTAEPRSQFV